MNSKKNMYNNYSKLLKAIERIKVEDSFYTKQYDFNISSFKLVKNGKIIIKNKKES